MIIKSIDIKKHPILGDIFLDFTNEKGPADTVIIAGENGTGKSTILSIISEFSSMNILNGRDIGEKRVIKFHLNNEEIKDFHIKGLFPNEKLVNNELIFTIDCSIQNDGNQIKATYKYLADDDKETNGDFPGYLLNNHNLIGHFSTIFSQVGINYDSKPIDTVKGNSVDKDVKGSLKSPPNLADEITQLLVDINVQDAEDSQDYLKKYIGKSIVIDPNLLSPRMRRFTNAFEFMFTQKKYKGVSTVNGSKQIVFEEGNKECNINELSSGEKQIVFRGSFLLQNKNSLNGNIVLIDEPEISMHPNRQLKILEFYKSLFINEQGIQTSQLIIVTHSPFIIHNGSRYNDKVLTLTKDKNSIITVDNPPKYFGFTIEEFVKNSFDLSVITNASKDTVFVEGPTDVKYIRKAAELLGKNDILNDINIEIIGLETPGGTINSNDDNLKSAEKFLSCNLKIINHKFLILHDPENNITENSYEDKVYIRKMEANTSNDVLDCGIEQLLSKRIIEAAVTQKKEYFKIIKIKEGQADEQIKIKILSGQKQNLCQRICDNGSAEDFIGFENIFRKFKEIF